MTAGVGAITLRQPVHAALSLVAGILALAAIYVTLEAHFLATSAIVYAGAVMVLFLFVIMPSTSGARARPAHG